MHAGWRIDAGPQAWESRMDVALRNGRDMPSQPAKLKCRASGDVMAMASRLQYEAREHRCSREESRRKQ